MEFGKLFFVSLMMFVNFNIFSQDLAKGFPKLMYVTSREGLRERSEPSTNSKIIETHQYGAMIQVFARQNNPVTINGITDYWYSTLYSNNSDRWIFGGYLSEELPNDLPVIIGEWDVTDDNGIRVVFRSNYFFRIGRKYSGEASMGTWKINKAGNQITVDLDGWEDRGGKAVTIYIQLNVIDKNNIELSFSHEQFGYNSIKLKRNITRE
jgi:hypothetical protein